MIQSLAQLAEKLGGCPDGVVAACGVFDGLHLGHRRVLESALELARGIGVPAVVITFHPHPRALLHPQQAPGALTTPEQKRRMFREMGFAGAAFLPFTRELAEMPPAQFIEHLMEGPIRLRGLCVGENWKFGHAGSGNSQLLKSLGEARGLAVRVCHSYKIAGHTVSSTRIRQAVCEGRLDSAGMLLGRPYSVQGLVGHGRGVGSATLSCPTANLSSAGILLPPDGIYVARVRHANASPTPAIAYVGRRPTFASTRHADPVVEVHLFECEADLYGQELEVEFLHFLRHDRSFPTVAALKEQIQADIRDARHWHAEHPAAPEAWSPPAAGGNIGND